MICCLACSARWCRKGREAAHDRIQVRSGLATAWERADRSVATPPVATQTGSQSVPEIAHHAINRDWQLLNFVLERRERISDYAPTRFNAVPLPNQAALLAQLRYAAGVEIAAMQEYLTAAWSLRPAGGFLRLRHQQRHREAGCRSREVEFAPDSPLEEAGFELSVPPAGAGLFRG